MILWVLAYLPSVVIRFFLYFILPFLGQGYKEHELWFRVEVGLLIILRYLRIDLRMYK